MAQRSTKSRRQGSLVLRQEYLESILLDVNNNNSDVNNDIKHHEKTDNLDAMKNSNNFNVDGNYKNVSENSNQQYLGWRKQNGQFIRNRKLKYRRNKQYNNRNQK